MANGHLDKHYVDSLLAHASDEVTKSYFRGFLFVIESQLRVVNDTCSAGAILQNYVHGAKKLKEDERMTLNKAA